jgi:hypothetical protein
LFGKADRNAPAEWIKVRVAKPIVAPALFREAQAKLATLNRNIWTDREMIEKLRLLLKKHGHLTRTLIDRSEDVQCVKAYENRFGSIEAAFAQVPYAGGQKLRQHVDRAGREPAEIAIRLRELHERIGYLNTVEIQKCARLPSIKFIVRKFGSLENAYRAAGCDLSRGQMIAAGRRRGRRSADGGRMIELGKGTSQSS